MKKTLLALLLAVWPLVLFAEDQKFTFALPDLDGHISLGVFNVRGKLVRTLFTNATQADFTVGLNGLITTWDGKSDIGTVMPAGKYYVRGYVIGHALKAEGEAYHFNDWIEDEKSPRIVKVEDFQKIDRGFILLARVPEAPGLSVIRYDLEKGFLWQKALPDPANVTSSLSRLAVGASQVLVSTGDALQTFNLATGDAQASKPQSDPVAALAAYGDAAVVATRDSLLKFSLPTLSSADPEKAPASFSALAATADFKIGGSPTQPEAWLAQGSDWKKVATGAGITSLSIGLKNTFWLAGSEEKGGSPLVGQFNVQGELLRAYRSDFVPEQVRASTESEEISVLEKKDATQRLRQMSQVDRPGGTPGWEISFEKAVTPCAHFGLVDGSLVADAGSTPKHGTMEFPLATGGLTPSSPKLTVQLASDASGLWLETASKLKLVRLSDQLHADRFILVPGENGASMTAYAGDGVVVAEYLVTGLDAIAEIDAGEIEIP